MQSSAWLKVVIAVFLFTSAKPFSALAVFNAMLQGQSRGSTTWINGNLQNWRDLDEIPCRVYLTGGPANNKVIKVEFDHMQGRNPGIQDIYGFSPSANVLITSAPVLSAPASSPRWTYTFTIRLLDRNPGWVNFYARLADGAHLNGGSSVGMRGSPSLGNLQIHKIGPKPGMIDLAVQKTGPSEATPGQTITYTLQYSNRLSAISAVQISDVFPAEVTPIAETLGSGRVVGNMIVWDVGSLAAGETGTISYSVQVNPNLAHGTTFTNSAVIACLAPSAPINRKKQALKAKRLLSEPCPAEANPNDNHSSVATRVLFNRAPIANPDAYTGTENQPVIVPAPGVLTNDSDPDGDMLSAILVDGPTHGTLVFNAHGGFTYTPTLNYHGEDAFTYKANDGMTDSAAVSVLILLQPVQPPTNDTPVAVNDEYGIPTDSILNVPAAGVLANDSDPNGDALSAMLVSGPANGTLIFNANGSFQYAPATGFAGTDAFTYKASDGSLDSLPALVTIVVHGSGETNPPANIPPVVALTNPTNGAIYIAGMDIPLAADASDADGSVVRVDFAASEMILGSDTEASYTLLLTNVPAGEYTFRAVATDDAGASTTSTPVAVTVLEHPPFASGPFRLNRQTGLFEQTVTVTNPTAADFNGIRLWIMGVRGGATVWNATGQVEGVPYIEVPGIIAAGGSVEIVIEYYTPDIRLAPTPTFLPELM